MDILIGGTRSGTTTKAAVVSSIERDRVVYNLPTHTVKAPRVVIISRNIPGGGDREVLKYGVKIVFGDRNTDGTAKSGNVILEAKISVPQDQGNALAEEAASYLAGWFANTTFVANAIENSVIPLA